MTLTEVSYYTRKFAPYAAMGFLFMLFLYFALNLLITLNARKPVEITYSTLFGPLPQLQIKAATPEAYPNFYIDTLSGKPQLQDEKGEIKTATDSAQVFLLPMPKSRTTSSDRVILTARKLNMELTSTGLPYTLTGDTATMEAKGKRLSVNIRNFNFTYEDAPGPYGPTEKNEQEIITDAINHFVNLGRYPGELAQGDKKVTYLFYDDKTQEYHVLPLAEIKNANAFEVNFYRPALNGLPTVTERYNTSPTYVVLTYVEGKPRVVKSQIAFYERFESPEAAIYPLKSVEQAFNELVEGKGKIIFYNPKEETVPVQQIHLAYFEDSEYQEYLQPVYVFTNNKQTFIAYIPAISDAYVKQAEESTKEAPPSGQEN